MTAMVVSAWEALGWSVAIAGIIILACLTLTIINVTIKQFRERKQK